MQRADFVNLSNGLWCCQVPEPHYLRIQSTWCEQKLWDDVLGTVGPDFLMHLARPRRFSLLVHDVSERPRTTRACWQGLTWIRFACERLWHAPEQPAIMRSGHNATAYFEDVLGGLSRRVESQITYYRRFYDGGTLGFDVCLNSIGKVPAWPLTK